MEELKKIIFFLCVCPLFLMITAISSYSQINEKKVDLKISGGLSYLTVGDWNTSNQGWLNSGKDLSDFTGGSISGEYKTLHWGLEVAGDFLFDLSSQLAASLGIGYIWINEGRDSSKIMATNDSITSINTHETKISAVPLTAGIHYFMPVSSEAKVSLSAGVGYYFAKFFDDYRLEDDTGYWFTRNPDTKSNGLGFHGGIGFEYSISQNLAIVVEGYGRYAKIGGFEGTEFVANSQNWSDSREGILYYYEVDRETGWYPVVQLGETAPSGDNVRDVREAKVDFSGFTVRIGLKFKLF
jgi:hypothetical protein